MRLYRPERHFPLEPLAWDPDLAQAEARRIIQSLARSYSLGAYWRPHPLDDETEAERVLPTVYMGVTGCAWAIWHWMRRTGEEVEGASGTIFDAEAVLEDWIKDPPTAEENLGIDLTSLFFGELGDRLLLDSMRPTKSNQRRILEILELGLAKPVEATTGELMAGVAGGLVAAVRLESRFEGPNNGAPNIGAGNERSNDHRKALVRSLIRRHIDHILATWQWQEDIQAFLWTQNYGRRVQYIGAAHGSVGNIHALLQASRFLAAGERDMILDRTCQLLERLALRGDEGVNWQAFVGQPPERDLLMHWCHGAPGIVMMLATQIRRGERPVLDELLAQGGELTWRAGALKKGASICHGTAGSGAACLKLFEHMRDEQWLDRAKVFAMNAIQQVRSDEATYGRLRPSLWTGDAGVAHFLLDCLEGSHQMPLLDVF